MSFPGWAGPLVGPVVGALAYVSYVFRREEELSVLLLLVFAGVGLVAGCILWVGDLVTRNRPRDEFESHEYEDDEYDDGPRRRGRRGRR